MHDLLLSPSFSFLPSSFNFSLFPYFSLQLKFAGDALIVLWPPPTRDSLTDAVSNKRGREGDTGEVSRYRTVARMVCDIFR